MILSDFEYERPETLEEAVALLAAAGDGARLLAGGTDLLPNMRLEIARPALLVSLGAIEPAPPALRGDGTLVLDALTRLADVESSALVRREAPMLAESAHAVAGNQVRHMGTLGGNLCQETRCLYLNQDHEYQFVAPCYKLGGDCCYPYPKNDRDTCLSVYMSDIAPALIALDAEAEILGPDGTRRLPVAELFTGDGLRPLALGRAEIIRSIAVPPRPERFGWGYRKSTIRGGLEFAMAVMAVALSLEDDGRTCREAKLVFGAIDQGPVRAPAAEESLRGAVPDDARLAAAADRASGELRPLPHHGFSAGYLKENIRVYLRRMLARAVERARGAAG